MKTNTTRRPRKGVAQRKVGGNSFFSWYFSINLLTRILVGLIGGAILGIIFSFTDPEVGKAYVSYTAFFGDLFVRLLKMIVVPVILFSLITGAASIAPTMLGRVGGRIMVFYLLTSAAAVAVGILLANILQPGTGMEMLTNAEARGRASEAPSLIATLLAVIPTNPIESLAKGDVLPIIFFAIFFGLALSYVKTSKDASISKGATNLLNLCTSAAEVMYKIVYAIMQYAPIGVFFLISSVFALQGPKVLGPLVLLLICVYLGLFVHLVLVYGGFLMAYQLSFIQFIKRANEAMITAFVTRSSNGTLPVTLRVSEHNLGVPRPIGSFTLPLGATINMDGTAIYLGVCAMFIAFSTAHPLTGSQQLTVVLTATLASIGTAGVPGAGAIMLLMVLESVGLKVEAGTAVAATYALVLGIDALLDMGRTSLNITGDLVGSVLVAKAVGELDETKWNEIESKPKPIETE